MPDLERITQDLDEAYRTWKGGETDKNARKLEFFDKIDELLALEDLPEHYDTVEAASEQDARERLEQRHPTRLVDDLRMMRPGTYEAILVDNPKFTPYTYVNRETGMAYRRQISQGSVMLDDERLQHDDPILWHKVTELPYETFLKNVIYECGVHQRDVDRRLDELLEQYTDAPQRVLVDLSTLDADVLAQLSQYIHYGPPKVSLPEPRKAKDEELE